MFAKKCLDFTYFWINDENLTILRVEERIECTDNGFYTWLFLEERIIY